MPAEFFGLIDDLDRGIEAVEGTVGEPGTGDRKLDDEEVMASLRSRLTPTSSYRWAKCQSTPQGSMI
jgi:hypothetical protein